MAGLPSFFQTSAPTLLEEFLEDGGGALEEDALDGLIDAGDSAQDLETFAEDNTFGFGDLKVESLPEFFTAPKMADAPSLSSSVSARTSLPTAPAAHTMPPPGFSHSTPVKANPPSQIMSPPGLVAPPGFAPPTPTPPSVTKPAYSAPPVPTPTRAPANPTAALAAPALAVAPGLTPQAHGLSLPPQQGLPNLGRGEYMSTSDVRFIAGKVLAPLEVYDPYTDDYYYLQHCQRHTQPAPPLPLPVWKEARERIREQQSAHRKEFLERVRGWEAQEGVLGHRVRAEVSRPRELLCIPSVHDMVFDDDEDEDDPSGDGGDAFRAPFSSRLWTTRQAVQRGYESIYTLQELHYLLSSALVQANVVAQGEVLAEVRVAQLLLVESLGIVEGSSPGDAAKSVGSLDGRHVAAIMQTTIGRKMLVRAWKFLTNTQRSTEALQVEKALLRHLAECVQSSYVEVLKTDHTDKTEVYVDLLGRLRQCVKNVVVTHMEKRGVLRGVLLAEKSRAEVMHLLVQVGEEVSLGAGVQHAEEWAQTKEAFMAMLDQ